MLQPALKPTTKANYCVMCSRVLVTRVTNGSMRAIGISFCGRVSVLMFRISTIVTPNSLSVEANERQRLDLYGSFLPPLKTFEQCSAVPQYVLIVFSFSSGFEWDIHVFVKI